MHDVGRLGAVYDPLDAFARVGSDGEQPNASAVGNVALAGVGATNQSLSGAGPRLAHDVQCDSINVAVVAPRVSRRDRFDFVDPITPHEIALAVGTQVPPPRHGVATHLVGTGQLLKAQARLGHRDPTPTPRHCSHAVALHDEDVADNLDQLLDNRP